MKVDYRDIAWSVAAILLLILLGLEWRRSHLIAQDIRARSTTEAPLELVKTNLDQAAFFLEFRYRANCQIDWQSLQALGLKPRMRITCTIQADTAQQAFEQLFGDQVKVTEDKDASQLIGRTVLRVQARRSAD
jgi:hypothetical protein